jgi:uncharacterized protein
LIAIEAHAQGAVLPVRVQPAARRNALAGERAGALRVSVTQAPEKGKANRAIVEVLCRALGLRKNRIDLLSGDTTANERFLVGGIDPSELAARLAAALETERRQADAGDWSARAEVIPQRRTSRSDSLRRTRQGYSS